MRATIGTSLAPAGLYAAAELTLRIKIIKKPTSARIDGIQLDRYEVGQMYDLGWRIGELMLVEGWAEPVIDDAPALFVPLEPPTNGTNRLIPSATRAAPRHCATDRARRRSKHR